MPQYSIRQTQKATAAANKYYNDVSGESIRNRLRPRADGAHVIPSAIMPAKATGKRRNNHVYQQQHQQQEANDDKALLLNQFQTDDRVAKTMVDILAQVLMETLPQIPWQNYLFIEPAAGEGAIYNLLPPTQRIGIDIDHDLSQLHSEYLFGDFLSLQMNDIVQHGTMIGVMNFHPSLYQKSPSFFSLPEESRRQHTVVIGNPPYNDGRRFRGGLRNTALQFLNHAAQMADTVAFLVGANFNRLDVQDKVLDDMQLIANIPLQSDDDSGRSGGGAVFRVNDVKYGNRGQRAKVNVVFQIWQRQYDAQTGKPLIRDKHRHLVPNISNGMWIHPETGGPGDFVILNPSDPRTNVCLRRWGVVGEVIADPGRIAELVAHAQETEHERRQRRPDIYKADYHLFRSTGSFFHLYCADPGKVSKRLQERSHMFRQYADSAAPGTSASINQRDLLRIYLQPTHSSSSS